MVGAPDSQQRRSSTTQQVTSWPHLSERTRSSQHAARVLRPPPSRCTGSTTANRSPCATGPAESTHPRAEPNRASIVVDAAPLGLGFGVALFLVDAAAL